MPVNEFDLVLYLETHPDMKSVKQSIRDIQKQLNDQKVEIQLDVNKSVKNVKESIEREIQNPLKKHAGKFAEKFSKTLTDHLGEKTEKTLKALSRKKSLFRLAGESFAVGFANAFGGNLHKTVKFMGNKFGLRMPMTRAPTGDYTTIGQFERVAKAPVRGLGGDLEGRYAVLLARMTKFGASLDDSTILLKNMIETNENLSDAEKEAAKQALQQVYYATKAAVTTGKTQEEFLNLLGKEGRKKFSGMINAISADVYAAKEKGQPIEGRLVSKALFSGIKAQYGTAGKLAVGGETAMAGMGKIGGLLGTLTVLPLIAQMISGIFAILSVIADNPLFGSLMKMFKALMKMIGTMLIMPLYILLYPLLRILMMFFAPMLRIVLPIFIGLIRSMNLFFKDPVGALKSLADFIGQAVHNYNTSALMRFFVNDMMPQYKNILDRLGMSSYEEQEYLDRIRSAIMSGDPNKLKTTIDNINKELKDKFGADIESSTTKTVSAIQNMADIYTAWGDTITGNGSASLADIVSSTEGLTTATNDATTLADQAASLSSETATDLDNMKTVVDGVTSDLTTLTNNFTTTTEKMADLTSKLGPLAGAITDLVATLRNGGTNAVGNAFKSSALWFNENINPFGWAFKLVEKYAPKRQTGGYIPYNGLFYLHAGEFVVPSGSNRGNSVVYAPNIEVNVSGDTSQSYFAEDLANMITEKIMEDLKRRGVFG